MCEKSSDAVGSWFGHCVKLPPNAGADHGGLDVRQHAGAPGTTEV